MNDISTFSFPNHAVRNVVGRRRQGGMTLLELLIVMGVVGVILGLSVVSGRRILQGQQERATVHSFEQAVSRSATAANAGNKNIGLSKEDDEFLVVDMSTNRVLQRYPIADSVQTGFPQRGPLLQFTPDGKATTQSLNSLQSPSQPIVFSTGKGSYEITVSRIGEVRVVPQ